MIEQLLIGLFQTAMGVTIGTYIGFKIGKKEIKRELTSFVTNELPHLLSSPKTELQIRKYAHIFFQELIETITEEEPDAEDREVRARDRKRTSARSQPRSE